MNKRVDFHLLLVSVLQVILSLLMPREIMSQSLILVSVDYSYLCRLILLDGETPTAYSQTHKASVRKW